MIWFPGHIRCVRGKSDRRYSELRQINDTDIISTNTKILFQFDPIVFKISALNEINCRVNSICHICIYLACLIINKIYEITQLRDFN